MNSFEFFRQLREAEPEIEEIWQQECEYDGRENTYLILAKVVNWILRPPTDNGKEARVAVIVPIFNAAYVSGDEELQNLIASEFLSELATSQNSGWIESMLNSQLRNKLADIAN